LSTSDHELARYRAAFDDAVVGMVLCDLEGRVLRPNAAFCRLVDHTAEELIGQDSATYTHPEDREVKNPVLVALGTGERSSATFEKRYLRADGTVVWAQASLSPSRDESGTITHLIAIVEDVTERKRVLQELAEARRRLDSALTAAEVATFEWDVQGNRLFGDPNFDRIFGVTLGPDGSAPIELFLDVIHPDDRPQVIAKVTHTVETGADYEAEYRITSKNRERTVIARGRLERDDERGTVRFPGVLLDITERRKLSDALERQSRIYDTLLSSTDDLAYLFDRDGRLLFANRRMLDVWQKTLDEVVGRAVSELGYTDEQATRHLREIHDVFDTKRTVSGEMIYTAPSGEAGTYEYILAPVINADGNVEAIAGTTRDITARKRSEQEQARLADQLRVALAAARMGAWHWDLETGLVHIDDRTRVLLGLTSNEPTFEEAVRNIHPDDFVHAQAAIGAAINPNDPRPYAIAYRVLNADGSIRWVSANGQSTLVPDGERFRAVSLVGTVLDVTDERTAEEALRASEARYRELAEVNEQLLVSERAARAEAEQASRIKDEFLATLSHELRTPLSAVLGWAQILGRGGSANADELAEGLSVIEQNARAQGQIIDDLLDMSRIVSGKVRLDTQPLDLANVVVAAIETLLPAATAKGVLIEPMLEAGAPVTGDPSRLQQVFWNLLSNAVKFTPRDGRVQVRMTRTATHASVSIADSGEGISEEFLPFVFDRFRQADASSTRQHAGLGLGLSIVRNLTELHGGTISAESGGVGRGATFTVTLPRLVSRTPVRPAAAAARGRAETIEGLRVLVVDDDPEARRLVKRFLEERGAQVTTASSAAEALDALAMATFGVLVSDVGMPGEDGHSLIRRIRDASNPMPAVAVSAYARPEDRAKSLAAGFHLHLVKPVDPAALVAAVASVTGRT
jgi:PAS domain S-box-containing protein